MSHCARISALKLICWSERAVDGAGGGGDGALVTITFSAVFGGGEDSAGLHAAKRPKVARTPRVTRFIFFSPRIKVACGAQGKALARLRPKGNERRGEARSFGTACRTGARRASPRDDVSPRRRRRS